MKATKAKRVKRVREKEWGDVVFYSCADTGETAADADRVDITYCPRFWSYRKVENKFKRRNPDWRWKTGHVFIGLLVKNSPEMYPLPTARKGKKRLANKPI